MPPTLQTPDGALIDSGAADSAAAAPVTPPENTDQQFSRALADPSPGATKEPPRHDQAPDAGQAPRRRRGRPPKNPDEKARAADKPADTAPVDYTEAAAGLTAMAWMTVAGIPWTSAYAVAIDANAAALTTALANGAAHNEKIRALLERAATGGDGVYMLQLAAAGANMAVQVAQIMRDPVLRAQAHQASQAKLRAYMKLNGIKLPDEAAEGADNEPAAS